MYYSEFIVYLYYIFMSQCNNQLSRILIFNATFQNFYKQIVIMSWKILLLIFWMEIHCLREGKGQLKAM